MPGLAQRAAVVALSRFASYGLMVISPIILVRVLSVEEFGLYREFLLYAALLQAFAAFSVGDSLLYFVPARRERQWRIVRQTIVLTACISTALLVIVAAIDRLVGGAVIGPFLLPVCLYVWLLVNLDFWEPYWIATDRLAWMFAYSTGRLLARLAVVVIAALVAGEVAVIVWSLVVFEAARFVCSGFVWRFLDRSREEPAAPGQWRELLRFCLPSGFATMLAMVNKNVGGVAVTKVLGTVALAHYTIGTYLEPLVRTFRNSLSAALLPEMVQRGAGRSVQALQLWHRATVVNLILLLPVAVVGARYAEPLTLAVFGDSYRPAIVVMQLYMLVVVRECFDFSPPLRALGRTGPLVHANAAAVLVTVVALLILLPVAGLAGAVAALVISRLVEAVYLGAWVKRLYRVGTADLLPWRRLLTVLAAATVCLPVLALPMEGDLTGLAGIALAGALYAGIFFLGLRLTGLDEANMLLQKLKAASERVRRARA